MSRIGILVSLLLWSCSVVADILVVTLLGTGTPRPEPERGGQAILIEAGNQKLLFDSGRGVAQKIYGLNMDFATVDKVFITHMHYDHIIGLSDLLLSGWLFQRTEPVQVWGPKGIKPFVEKIHEAYSADIHHRSHLPERGASFIAHDVEPGVVYQKAGLKVTAFRVDHGHVKPAYGYRIDYRGRSVVISGDTKYSSEVIKQARSVDLLIHELIAVSEELLKVNKRLQRVYAYHTNPKDLIKVIEAAKPKMTVLVHRLIFGLPAKQVLDEIKLASKARVLFGNDLDAFDIGEDIRVYRR